MKSSVDILFEPVQINSLTLKNRIAMAPMTRSAAPLGVPSDAMVEYYRRRAAGGTALLFSEAACINHKAAQGMQDTPFMYGEQALAGWKKVVDGVHAAGGKMVAQLFHAGMLRQATLTDNPDVPSYVASKLDVPAMASAQEMSLDDIQDVIGAFAQAAKCAKSNGFDGVEIHAAHGYLIDQFLWAATNHRTDQYGGNMENRSRLARDIIVATRQAVGADFPISLRWSQWKLQDFSAQFIATPELLAEFLQPLSEAGVDIFHCSTRRVWEPEFKGSELNLAGWVKKLTGKPTIAVGSVSLDADVTPLPGTTHYREAEPRSIDDLLEQLQRQEFDMIAVGRAMIANPDWADKVRNNRFDELQGYKKTMLDALV